MLKNYFKYFKWVSVAMLLLFINNSFAQTLVAKVNRNSVALGETLQLTLTVNGNAPNGSPNLAALEKNFRVISAAKNRSVNIINNKTITQAINQIRNGASDN